MPAIASERMSRVDTAWLRMDNDVNLMMIVGVWRIQPGIAYEALCERVQDKLLPKVMPQIPGLQAMGWTRPASMRTCPACARRRQSRDRAPVGSDAQTP